MIKFIIVAPGYDDDSGGIVVLHQFCDHLNQLGYQALLCPIFKPTLDFTNPLKTIYSSLLSNTERIGKSKIKI